MPVVCCRCWYSSSGLSFTVINVWKIHLSAIDPMILCRLFWPSCSSFSTVRTAASHSQPTERTFAKCFTSEPRRWAFTWPLWLQSGCNLGATTCLTTVVILSLNVQWHLSMPFHTMSICDEHAPLDINAKAGSCIARWEAEHQRFTLQNWTSNRVPVDRSCLLLLRWVRIPSLFSGTVKISAAKGSAMVGRSWVCCAHTKSWPRHPVAHPKLKDPRPRQRPAWRQTVSWVTQSRNYEAQLILYTLYT